MTFRERLRVQVADAEGLRLTAYQDSRGVWTLGWGHNLANPIPRAAAILMLEADLEHAAQDVHDRLPWSLELNEPRRAVLVDMSFNLGIGGLLEFTQMLEAASLKDWTTAAAEMLDSRWATQVGDRAKRLARQMLEGTWQRHDS